MTLRWRLSKADAAATPLERARSHRRHTSAVLAASAATMFVLATCGVAGALIFAPDDQPAALGTVVSLLALVATLANLMTMRHQLAVAVDQMEQSAESTRGALPTVHGPPL